MCLLRRWGDSGEEGPKACWAVTTSQENKTICAGTSNQKNKRDLANARIGGMQKEQITRKRDLWSPRKSLRKQRINQELIRGGSSHTPALVLRVPEHGGLLL